jgi:hypothetical protein
MATDRAHLHPTADPMAELVAARAADVGARITAGRRGGQPDPAHFAQMLAETFSGDRRDQLVVLDELEAMTITTLRHLQRIDSAYRIGLADGADR